MSTSKTTTIIGQKPQIWRAKGKYYHDSNSKYTAIVVTDIDFMDGKSWRSPDDPVVQESMVKWANFR
jgi:hypothetical protein